VVTYEVLKGSPWGIKNTNLFIFDSPIHRNSFFLIILHHCSRATSKTSFLILLVVWKLCPCCFKKVQSWSVFSPTDIYRYQQSEIIASYSWFEFYSPSSRSSFVDRILLQLFLSEICRKSLPYYYGFSILKKWYFETPENTWWKNRLVYNGVNSLFKEHSLNEKVIIHKNIPGKWIFSIYRLLA